MPTEIDFLLCGWKPRRLSPPTSTLHPSRREQEIRVSAASVAVTLQCPSLGRFPALQRQKGLFPNAHLFPLPHGFTPLGQGRYIHGQHCA